MELVLPVIATIVGTLTARRIIPRISGTSGAGKLAWPVQLAAPVVSFVSVLAVFLITGHGEQIFRAGTNEFGLHATQILVSVAIVGIGVAASLFKRWNKGLYGLVEMMFAAASAFAVARTLIPQKLLLFQW